MLLELLVCNAGRPLIVPDDSLLPWLSEAGSPSSLEVVVVVSSFHGHLSLLWPPKFQSLKQDTFWVCFFFLFFCNLECSQWPHPDPLQSPTSAVSSLSCVRQCHPCPVAQGNCWKTQWHLVLDGVLPPPFYFGTRAVPALTQSPHSVSSFTSGRSPELFLLLS